MLYMSLFVQQLFLLIPTTDTGIPAQAPVAHTLKDSGLHLNRNGKLVTFMLKDFDGILCHLSPTKKIRIQQRTKPMMNPNSMKKKGGYSMPLV